LLEVMGEQEQAAVFRLALPSCAAPLIAAPEML
jgi:hypothetical protein